MYSGTRSLSGNVVKYGYLAIGVVAALKVGAMMTGVIGIVPLWLLAAGAGSVWVYSKLKK